MGHRREVTSWKVQREMVRCSVLECKRVLKCRNWGRAADYGDDWRRRIEEAKAQVGLEQIIIKIIIIIIIMLVRSCQYL
jgi:hypothetical protein